MKIGVLTLSLRANYGGNLQAFALMTALRDMGHEVWFINRERHKVPTWKFPLRIARRLFEKIILRKKNYVVFDAHESAMLMQHSRRFIDQHIQPQTQEFLSSAALTRDIGKYNFDAIIVGSDQVWRRNYIAKNFTDYFLGFLSDENKKIKRISYAASFGTTDWIFSPAETEVCSKLIQQFNAISVREDSGVDLCRQYLSIKAEHVIDPTLLLDAECYLKLLPESDTMVQDERGGILVYILDEDDEKENVVNSIAQVLGEPVFRVNKNTDDTTRPLYERIAPPVEDWLCGFRDADFVITDSFHGAVFSIIFNKPFVVYGNAERGMARFASLLKMFDLENRLVISAKQLDASLICSAPDWCAVNRILDKQRVKARQFLRSALSS